MLFSIGLCTEHGEIKCSIVLSGDPKQLDAVAKSKYAIRLGIKTSYMEHLCKYPRYQRNAMTGRYDPRYIIQLTKNYRTHPDLLQIPNDLFYDGLLEAKAPSDVANWLIGTNILPNREVPIIFRSIKGDCKESLGSSSYNLEEVNAVIKCINDLLANKWNGKNVFEDDIGIVSPYKEQCEMIKDECLRYGYEKIMIGTAEIFQGQEKPIMIVSTVRTDGNLGFVRDKRVTIASHSFILNNSK